MVGTPFVVVYALNKSGDILSPVLIKARTYSGLPKISSTACHLATSALAPSIMNLNTLEPLSATPLVDKTDYTSHAADSLLGRRATGDLSRNVFVSPTFYNEVPSVDIIVAESMIFNRLN
jgi:hypothetical protein